MTTLMQWRLSWLRWNGIALKAGGGLLLAFSVSSLLRSLGSKRREPGREDNTAILQLKWCSGKMKKLATFKPMPASNATSRFSDRVDNYVRYRPGYPPEVLQALKRDCGLVVSHCVADIAAGTGIWTRMLLEDGNPVFGVEPNAEMRAAGERLLAGFPK